MLLKPREKKDFLQEAYTFPRRKALGSVKEYASEHAKFKATVQEGKMAKER